MIKYISKYKYKPKDGAEGEGYANTAAIFSH